jgi:hypothetical protein
MSYQTTGKDIDPVMQELSRPEPFKFCPHSVALELQIARASLANHSFQSWLLNATVVMQGKEASFGAAGEWLR